jgi:hypothetical protein
MKSHFAIPLFFIAFTAYVTQASEDWCVLPQADGFHGIWKPDDKSIPQLLSNAKSYLEKLQKDPKINAYDLQDIKNVLKRWDRYRCQIVGYQKGGRKMIHFNFFPKARGSDDRFKYWRERLVKAYDGGSSFWRVDFDVSAGAFIRFETNGIA